MFSVPTVEMLVQTEYCTCGNNQTETVNRFSEFTAISIGGGGTGRGHGGQGRGVRRTGWDGQG